MHRMGVFSVGLLSFKIMMHCNYLYDFKRAGYFCSSRQKGEGEEGV